MSVGRATIVALVIAVGVPSSMIAGTSVAAADNKNSSVITAQCDNGQTVTVEVVFNGSRFPSAVHVIDSTVVFTIHQFMITNNSTGEMFVLKNDSGVGQSRALVSCRRAGTNFDFTWTGFFTPAP